MSGIEPLTAIALGQTAFGALQGIGSASAARAQTDAQVQSVAANAVRQRQMLQLQQEADTRKRRNLLERTAARARVSFGARGLSDADGSAGALLSGIENEFEVEQAARDRVYGLQMAGIDQGIADSLVRIEHARSRNLLDQQSDIQRRVGSLLRWGLKPR
ncbi:MAG: hypothetical protein ING44_13780 [Telmatospirillum sp.]|nr:hypothetical protein [Telmatospirillum sp.]